MTRKRVLSAKGRREREMLETESLTAGLEDVAATVTTHWSKSPMTEDSEIEEEEADPWMPMVDETMQEHKTAFQEMKMNLIQWFG